MVVSAIQYFAVEGMADDRVPRPRQGVSGIGTAEEKRDACTPARALEVPPVTSWAAGAWFRRRHASPESRRTHGGNSHRRLGHIGRARRLKLVLKRMSDAELRELERINRLDEIRTWELSRSTENEYDVTIHCDGERPGPATPSDPGNQRR